MAVDPHQPDEPGVQGQQRALGDHLRIGVALRQRLAAAGERAEGVERAAQRRLLGRAQRPRARAASADAVSSSSSTRAAACARAPRYSSAQSSSSGSEVALDLPRGVPAARRARPPAPRLAALGREGDALAARAHASPAGWRGSPPPARASCRAAAPRAGAAARSAPPGSATRRRRSPRCAVRPRCCAGAARAGARAPARCARACRRRRARPRRDPGGRRCGASSGPLLAAAVERDRLALRGAPARRARFARPRVGPDADAAAREAQRLAARRAGRGPRAGTPNGAGGSRASARAMR